MEIVELKGSSNMEKYLDLPSLVGKSRLMAFQDIVGEEKGKIGNWKNRFLSQAGREVLIKAVLK